jgi:hypothetical protein
MIITWSLFYYAQGWSFVSKLVIPFYKDKKIFKRIFGESPFGGHDI